MWPGSTLFTLNEVLLGTTDSELDVLVHAVLRLILYELTVDRLEVAAATGPVLRMRHQA